MDQFAQYPCINSTTLAMLRKSTAGNPAYLSELFQCFLNDSHELLKEMQDGCNDKNKPGYYGAVHTLKGLCGTIGCTRMFEILKVMDLLNKEESFENSFKYLEQLELVFQDTTEAIKAEVFDTAL